MLNAKEYFNQLESTLAVKELDNETAAAIQGGAADFAVSINFDTSFSTGTFTVPPGGGIIILSSTQSGNNNPSFLAAVRNVNTGNSTPPKSVRVGTGISTKWTGLRGGSYKIDLTDTKDNIFVSGGMSVIYDQTSR